MISYVSRKHKMQFSHIPKSGCQSIRHFIIKINEDDPNMNIWFGDFSSKYIHNSTKTIEGFTHYSFVRNPYTRLVSCYYNKVVGQHWNHFSRHFKNKYCGGRPSFEEFVRCLSHGKANADEHWMPQTSLINNGQTNIFKIEDSDKINEEMVNKTTHSFFHFKPKDHMEERYDLQKYVGNIDGLELGKMFLEKKQPLPINFYNKEILEIVYDLYECDFRNFKYSRELT